MQVSKKLTTIFTLAAGITAGSIIGVGTLYKDYAAPAQQPAATATVAFNAASRTAVEADIVKVGSDYIDVRAHTWVGQYTAARICTGPATQDCSYTARITDATGTALTKFRAGQTVWLHGLAGTPGGGAVTFDMPKTRPTSDVVKGPVRAHVVRLGDGDTAGMLAEIWPGNYVIINVRFGEIDTPEKGGRAKCPEEAALAAKASAETARLIGDKDVLLYDIQYEKYGGRVLADVRTVEGVSAAQNLIDKKLARPYDGGKKQPWCAVHAK
jgi:micrococcal nuclease